MSSLITVDGNTLGTQAETPAIRTFQIDPSGLGGIAESVNLFRGDISVPIELVTVTSRSGLEAGLRLVYNSNIKNGTDTWNLDAPTGPLGLGWTLGYEFIALDNRSTGARNNDRYYLIADGSSNRLHFLNITSTYWEFEAENYQFWQIRYYLAEEKWVIIKEEGNRYIYGGATSNSASSPVQFNVKWGGSTGNWVGSSVRSTGQSPYAVGWNLSSIVTPWGEAVNFVYENDLLALGTSAGLEYTRSTRLKQIIAPTSRTITLNYAAKEFNSQIREYQIPHIDTTSPSLIAYQDRYETHFLTSVEVRNSDDAPSGAGELIVQYEFDYALVNMSLDYQENPDFYKRYLRSITPKNDRGLAQPSMEFYYYNEPQADLTATTNRGALKSILYPQGGQVTYSYYNCLLEGTSRIAEIATRGTPRVWFGPDYCVITSYNGITRGLSVRIYSWNGLWVEADITYDFPIDINLDTLNVSVEQDFFVVSFITDTSNPSLYIAPFHKQIGRYGQWHIEEETDLTILPISNGDQGLSATGDQFFVACSSGGNILAKVWDPRTKEWIDRSNSLRIDSNAQYALAATADYFALANHPHNSSQVSMRIYYLNDADNTFQQASLQISNLTDVAWQPDSTPNLFWALGPDYAVMTYIIGGTDSEIRYSVKIQQWDESFSGRLKVDETYTIDSETKLPYAQSVASGSEVGNLGHLFRFDGVEWQSSELTLRTSDSEPAFIYGNDAAILSGEFDAQLALFDAFRLRWSTIRTTTPSREGIVPTINGNYLSIDREIYYRDNTNQNRLGTPIYTLPSNVEPKSLINSAPYFIAYEDNNGNTHILPLENGQVNAAAEIVLSNESIYVDSQGAGSRLVGPSSFVTYRGRFDSPSSMTLYQYVDQTIDGQTESFVISELIMDDGYPVVWQDEQEITKTGRRVAYYYDCENVTVTPDGKVTGFAAATAVYNSTSSVTNPYYPAPDKTLFGRSEYRYHNNRTPRESGLIPDDESLESAAKYYSFLNGQLFDKTDYAADGEPVNRIFNVYEVRTEYAPINSLSERLPLVGGYVKPISAETTSYPQTVQVDDRGINALYEQTIPPNLLNIYTEHGIEPTGTLVPARTGRRWRLYLNAAPHHFLSISSAAGALTTSLPVVRSVNYEYSWATGLLTSDSTDNYNSAGEPETNRRQIYYCWQVSDYAIMKDRHIWSPVVLSIKFYQGSSQSEPGSPVEFALTTFKDWGTGNEDATITKWSPDRTYSALTADVYASNQTIPIRFSAWDSESAVDSTLWRQLSKTTVRGDYGTVVEALDVSEQPSTTLLDRTQTQRVAEFTNAWLGEVAYLGFEAYESTSAWQLSVGPVADNTLEGDAHTGFRSLPLPSGSTLQCPLTLQTKGTVYILSCWIKTKTTFNSDNGQATWEISSDDQSLASFNIEGTTGDWEYRHYVIELTEATNSEVQVTLKAQNQKVSSSSVLLLDDILFAPLVSETNATIYHPHYTDELATVLLSGDTIRAAYSSRRVAIANTDARNYVTSGLSFYVIRQQSQAQDFTFPESYPNSLFEIQPARGGTLANLVQGENWQQEWSSTTLKQWDTEMGKLVHQIAGSSRIVFTPTTDLQDYGALVTVHLPIDANGEPILPQHQLGMSIGDTLSATWDPTDGWIITLANERILVSSSTEETPTFDNDWLLLAPKDPISGKTSVFFMANGELLFSRLDTPAIDGALSLFVTDKDIAFSDIATLEGPQLSVTYLDGSGKERQKQSFSGAGTVVVETVYDQVGRPAVATKAAMLEGILPGYQTTFVQTFNPVSGKMTGEIATAYPNDQGYPYTRTEFYPTAQSLAHKRGVPGEVFAIVQSGSLAAPVNENSHVAQYEYGTNSQGQFGDSWPSGEYFVTRLTDPNGDVQYTITSKTDQEIARIGSVPNDDGQEFQIFQNFYDGAGRLTQTLLPKGVTALQAGESNYENWAIINTYNFIGETVSTQTPDAGTTYFISDLAGQVRFTMDAEGNNPNNATKTILYAKYDALGRTTEEGYFQGQWQPAELEQKARYEPDWPDATQPHTVVLKNSYDGDGSNPTLFGQLSQSVVYPEDATKRISESYIYDIVGNLLTKNLTVDAFDTAERTVGYTYDALNRMIQVDYPDGSDIASITYLYDRLGQIVQIGTPEEAAAFGTFTYNAQGAIATSTLHLGAAKFLSYRAQFNSPGWPLVTQYTNDDTEAILEETFTYTQDGYNDAGYYDGKIASITTTGNGDNYTYRFQYDSLSRLKVAENTEDTGASYGVNGAANYDLNDNLNAVTRGTRSEQYTYVENSDRLHQVTADGDVIDAYTYNRNGAVTSGSRLDITNINYDPAFRKADDIQLGSNAPSSDPDSNVSFQYGSNRDRVLKRQQDSQGNELAAKLYIRDVNSQSLLESNRTANGESNNAQYIYGPDGLIGLQTARKRYTVVKDYQGSVRRVVDENGTVVATYNYTAFGATVTRAGSTEPDIIYYRYTGQEYDSELGLYNYKARFYDPELGRFYDVDPQLEGASPYIYVRNNPTNLIDPGGEAALTFFLATLLFGAIIGAVAGATTYLINSEGKPDVGKFFLYAVTGAVVGAASSFVGYGTGLLTTAGLASLGVSTSTGISSIASGTFVGAVSGAADGAVSSSLNQIGVNLIENPKDPFKGVGAAAKMGAGIGAGIGAIAGGITGASTLKTRNALADPDRIVSQTTNGSRIEHSYSIPRHDYADIANAVNQTNADEVLAIGAHGSKTQQTLRFTQTEFGNGVIRKTVDQVLQDMGGNFTGKGISLQAVCHSGRSGVAQRFASELRVPVRGSWWGTSTPVNGKSITRYKFGIFGREYRPTIFGKRIQAPMHTYYPSKLKTGWVAIFGY